ncbi:MAG: AraC family transcriptional regulator, partial [Ignavibacteria bacterium]|nr:AraC family transcriptional regulator [Ignavibacteria bacterium]
IPLFQGVVDAIQPYAKSNQVNLIFKPEITELIVEYHPEIIIHDVTQLLCNIIAFTPQTYRVEMNIKEVIVDDEPYLEIGIKNGGADLARITEITAHITNNVNVTSLKQNGTLYQLFITYEKPEIQEISNNISKIDHHGIPAYYAQISKKLRSHFAHPENLERAATYKNQADGVFLQKINALIISNLEREGFDPDCLCKGMALSRTKLYRKLTALTHQPPAQYIQFVRLQKAKEYLQNTELNVGEVVLKVGFASHSHFTRAFHDQFGFNPSFLKKDNPENGT